MYSDDAEEPVSASDSPPKQGKYPLWMYTDEEVRQ